MALSIKTEEADRLAREIAAETGETLTDAVTVALRERLDRLRVTHDEYLERIRRIQAEFAALPVIDDRTPDEIVGDDEFGIPT